MHFVEGVRAGVPAEMTAELKDHGCWAVIDGGGRQKKILMLKVEFEGRV